MIPHTELIKPISINAKDEFVTLEQAVQGVQFFDPQYLDKEQITALIFTRIPFYIEFDFRFFKKDFCVEEIQKNTKFGQKLFKHIESELFHSVAVFYRNKHLAKSLFRIINDVEATVDIVNFDAIVFTPYTLCKLGGLSSAENAFWQSYVVDRQTSVTTNDIIYNPILNYANHLFFKNYFADQLSIKYKELEMSLTEEQRLLAKEDSWFINNLIEYQSLSAELLANKTNIMKDFQVATFIKEYDW